MEAIVMAVAVGCQYAMDGVALHELYLAKVNIPAMRATMPVL